jgi:hypothetical protein
MQNTPSVAQSSRDLKRFGCNPARVKTTWLMQKAIHHHHHIWRASSQVNGLFWGAASSHQARQMIVDALLPTTCAPNKACDTHQNHGSRQRWSCTQPWLTNAAKAEWILLVFPLRRAVCKASACNGRLWVPRRALQRHTGLTGSLKARKRQRGSTAHRPVCQWSPAGDSSSWSGLPLALSRTARNPPPLCWAWLAC